MFDALHDGIPWFGINSARTASFHFAQKRLLIRKEPPEGGNVVSNLAASLRSVVIDDDLAAVVVHIPIMIAFLDDDRVVIVMIAVANHIDIAVAMALADRHAGRTHTDANLSRNQ